MLTTTTDEATRERLLERLGLFSSKAWLNDYFDLVQDLLEYTGLDGNDPRLVISLPIGQRVRLPVIINSRLVLAAFSPDDFKSEGRTREGLGFIFRKSPEDPPEIASRNDYWSFSRGRREEEPPFLLDFEKLGNIPRPVYFLNQWKKIASEEKQHASKSVYRRFHSDIVYRMTVDLPYRHKMLDEAFEKKGSQV